MENKDQSLQIPELKKQLDDLFPANPLIYWFDFLGSAAIGYISFILADHAAVFSLAQAVFFLIAVFAIYRAALFIHELTHQDRSKLPGFSIVWNLVLGIPMLVPSFMYRGVHADHHKKTTYSTIEDGEYLPLGVLPFWKTVAYVAQSFVIPATLWIRFGILAPLSLLHPALRSYIMRRLSALAIRFDVDRKIPTGIDLRNWYILEAMCTLFTWSVAVIWYFGFIDWTTFTLYYATIVAMLFVNSIRTVVAHRYRNKDGHELAFQDQLDDSINIGGNMLVANLVAPVGLRYHALHHLFQSIPYHNLGEAHRRLMKTLPADSIYHHVNEPSLWHALYQHWKNTQQASAAKDFEAAHASKS